MDTNDGSPFLVLEVRTVVVSRAAVWRLQAWLYLDTRWHFAGVVVVGIGHLAETGSCGLPAWTHHCIDQSLESRQQRKTYH